MSHLGLLFIISPFQSLSFFNFYTLDTLEDYRSYFSQVCLFFFSGKILNMDFFAEYHGSNVLFSLYCIEDKILICSITDDANIDHWIKTKCCLSQFSKMKILETM